ncbi:MAG: HU family DNA-binding protein [Mailhella sp.]|nr:HU family DNA-binding protein [Mailhella sp.]
MTKAELIAKIAEKGGMTKASAETSLKALIDSVEEVLASEGRIVLPGFGTLAVEERKERQGRNPATGAPITIPAAKVVKFKAGAKLKNQIQ